MVRWHNDLTGKRHLITWILILAPAVALLATSCTGVNGTILTAAPAAVLEAEPQASTVGDAPYLLFNQRMIEGSLQPEPTVADVEALFALVFHGLPDEVTVYPSENYYYFVLYVDQRQIWGNIRLPAGARDEGELSFGYFEFVEFPWRSGEGESGSKFFNVEDGVVVEAVDRFTYRVAFEGKSVLFHLHQLDQSPPARFSLAPGEIFVERTMDESGYQFFLLFNAEENYFFWVLNEEETVPDVLEPMGADLVVGKRSGFAFWVDKAQDDRKVLMAVRKLSITRNDYYDGPFDQLADNYAEERNISEYMQRAYPALKGRIDRYGYYTDRERPMRVALSTYFTYYAEADLEPLLAQVQAATDPYALISRRGGAAPVQSPTPEP